MRAVSDQQRMEISQRYLAGEVAKELAVEYGIAHSTVYRYVKLHGGDVRAPHVGVRKGRDMARIYGQEMAAMYTAGARLEDVSLKYGVSISTVAKSVRASGGEVRKRGYGSIPPPMGSDNPAWRGGTVITDQGYRLIRIDPGDPMIGMAHAKGRYVPEHRLVMARAIGRPLLPTETVHHIDGDRLNNTQENLQLRSGRHGKGVHFRCHDCGSQNVGAVEL